MAHPYHHAVSSVRKWGGVTDDYIDVHRFFDQSKSSLADFRHRAMLHNTAGIFLAEQFFGQTITLSTCRICGEDAEHGNHHRGILIGRDHEFLAKQIPTRWIGEQHVQEDLGRIPTLADWLSRIAPEPWMNRSRRLSAELEKEEMSA